jgi:prepilin-type N-terminal cleavage/methylation domain-containing protein
VAKAGFSLIELAIVLSILVILGVAMIPRIAGHLALARDARRLSDIDAIRDAIDRYYHDWGVYPPATASAFAGGWDISNDGDFIPELAARGYLTEMPRDPVNDDTYHYRYAVYAKGQYGCTGETPYYVLGIRNFETVEFATRHRGFFKCGDRDWSTELAYVTGGGASVRR